MRKESRYRFYILMVMIMGAAGCFPLSHPTHAPQVYSFPETEPEWIRSGEPLTFEGESWYPQDNIALLLDSEVIRLGTYKDVEFFVEKTDVRPYNRLYTKFDKNKFRLFEEQGSDDRR